MTCRAATSFDIEIAKVATHLFDARPADREKRRWPWLAATALLIQFLVAAPVAGAQGIVAPAAPDHPTPKAAFPIIGAALTGGPYLDLILASQYTKAWSEAGTDAIYNGTFWLPTNLPPGYYPLGSFGQGNMSWSDKDTFPSPASLGNIEARVMLVAKELKPGYLRAPIAYRHIWNDAGSGAGDDGAMWEPIPADGYVCLGTVATNNNTGQVPPLDAIRCVWNTLVVEGGLAQYEDKDHVVKTAPFWATNGTSANAYFQAVRILPTDEHGPAFGIDVGTFRGIAVQADVSPPAYVLNSLAVAKQVPPTAAAIESFIQANGPVIRMHPNEQYLPDSVTAVLDTKTHLCRGVIRNDSSYDDIAFIGVVCNPTSAATLIADDAKAWLDPLHGDPDFKTWLNIDDSVTPGNLGRAWSPVRVKSTNQVFVDLQFWLYYPYNGPAKVRANAHLIEVGDLLNIDIPTDPTGRHSSDWEYVTLRLARTTAGPDLTFTHVIGSAHDFNLTAETNNPALQWSGNHPVLYSALDSHAHFLSAAKHDRGLAFHMPFIDTGSVPVPVELYGILIDYTADGGQVYETWRPGKHTIVSSQWGSIPATNPPWMFFGSRWGQYPKWNFEISCFTIDPIVYSVQTVCPNASIFKEIGSGPYGPITKGSWPDVKDTTAPVIQASVLGTPGSPGWYRGNVNVSFAVNDPEGPFVLANCDPVALTAETAGTAVSCTAYSAGGRNASVNVVKIDKTPPTITATASPPPNSFGWNNTTVKVTFTCSDAMSGVDTIVGNCDGGGYEYIEPTDNGEASGIAFDLAGNFAHAASVFFRIDKYAPTVPGNVGAAAASPVQVSVSWSASNDDRSGLAGYEIERCTGTGCTDFSQAGTTNSLVFTNSNRIAGTSYSYRVRAFDFAGNNSAFSTVTTIVTPGAGDTTAPGVPTALYATAVSSSAITVHWDASVDEAGGSGLAGYNVERCTGAGCANFAQLTATNLQGIGDTGLSAGTSYSYRVRAADVAGNLSAYSAVATAVTNTLAPGPNADLALTISDGKTGLTPNASTTYTIVVTNNGPTAADNAVVRAPGATDVSKTAAACTAVAGGAVCPATTSVALLEGAGVQIPVLPAGATVTFAVTATLTAFSGTVTQTATVAVPGTVVDPTPANNTASDTDAVGLAPQVGWWWNPAESGRGFFIEQKGNILFMAGYFYAEDGRAMWAISGGPISDLTHYTGRLVTVRDGQTLVGPYRAPPPGEVADAGEISLSFTEPTHGTLTWVGGTIAIERQIFGGGDASFQPSGWWWNPDQNGRGFSVEVQGDVLDVVGFMYDGAGNPVWYISAGKMTSPTHYAGDLVQLTGGQTMTGPYKVPTFLPAVGTITLDFASLTTGTMTLTDAATPPASVTFPIEPELAGPAP